VAELSPERDVNVVSKQVSVNVRLHISLESKTDNYLCYRLFSSVCVYMCMCVGAEIYIYRFLVLSKIHESENMKCMESLGYYTTTTFVIYARHLLLLDYAVKSMKLRMVVHATRIER
jgi:hypothetical protein